MLVHFGNEMIPVSNAANNTSTHSRRRDDPPSICEPNMVFNHRSTVMDVNERTITKRQRKLTGKLWWRATAIYSHIDHWLTYGRDKQNVFHSTRPTIGERALTTKHKCLRFSFNNFQNLFFDFIWGFFSRSVAVFSGKPHEKNGIEIGNCC